MVVVVLGVIYLLSGAASASCSKHTLQDQDKRIVWNVLLGRSFEESDGDGMLIVTAAVSLSDQLLGTDCRRLLSCPVRRC